jgi:hypothetical protein
MSKVADLNYLLQGGQLYRAFPFNKDSTAQDLITEQQTLKGGETKFPFTLIHHWPYSKHFIFFITYDWAHKVTVFAPAGLVNLVEYNTPAHSAHS